MGIPTEEGANWLTADECDTSYHEYTEEEIASIVRMEREQSNEEEEEEDINPPIVSHASACQALQTVLTYLEQQPSVPMGTMVTLNGLLIEAAKKRVTSQKQTKLNDYFCKL